MPKSCFETCGNLAQLHCNYQKNCVSTLSSVPASSLSLSACTHLHLCKVNGKHYQVRMRTIYHSFPQWLQRGRSRHWIYQVQKRLQLQIIHLYYSFSKEIKHKIVAWYNISILNIPATRKGIIMVPLRAMAWLHFGHMNKCSQLHWSSIKLCIHQIGLNSKKMPLFEFTHLYTYIYSMYIFFTKVSTKH